MSLAEDTNHRRLASGRKYEPFVGWYWLGKTEVFGYVHC